MSVLNLFNLEGEVAVVTGAGKGIGRGIALSLAEAGADIALASRSEDQLNAVANEIKGIGKRALVIPTDVTDTCLLYTSPSPRDATLSRMPSSA